MNETSVPFFSEVGCVVKPEVRSRPFSYSRRMVSPSRNDCTLNDDERAFTALRPTPFMPTDFWKFLSSNLAPVWSLLTAASSMFCPLSLNPKGMPRP